jgi:ABC-2 type transport system ATP-binding protein
MSIEIPAYDRELMERMCECPLPESVEQKYALYRLAYDRVASGPIPHPVLLGIVVEGGGVKYKAKDTEEISRTARNGTIELLKLVGLEDKKNFEVKNLSGGQKQRFTIATSLVHNPKILFLDEPTTGLDPKARRDLWALIKNLNNQGMTIVLTTHYMEEAEFLCHRVAILDQGKILQIDEPRKLVEDLSHTTQVAFLTEEKIDPGVFSNVPGIEKIYNDYPKVVLEVKDLDHISQIVQLLKKNKIAFSGFSVKTASLEDVYLDLTGRQFGETYE